MATAVGGPDLTVSLPTDTATFAAIPRFDAGQQHALILAEDVSADELEALAVSQDLHAGWVGPACLQLLPGVSLLGPWPIEEGFDAGGVPLPDWAAQVVIVKCPRQRGASLPPELAGLDPVADAFPLAQPEGTELLALTRLRAIARRLAGGLLLCGDAVGGLGARSVLVVPDSGSAVDQRVFAPVWLTPDACEALVRTRMPQAALRLEAGPGQVRGSDGMSPAELARLTELLGEENLDKAWRQARESMAQAAEYRPERSGYVVEAPIDAGSHASRRSVAGRIEVRVEPADALPLAVLGESWAGAGVVMYQVVWSPENPQDRYPGRMSRSLRTARDEAAAWIDVVASALADACGGRVVDEDDFLIA